MQARGHRCGQRGERAARAGWAAARVAAVGASAALSEPKRKTQASCCLACIPHLAGAAGADAGQELVSLVQLHGRQPVERSNGHSRGAAQALREQGQGRVGSGRFQAAAEGMPGRLAWRLACCPLALCAASQMEAPFRPPSPFQAPVISSAPAHRRAVHVDLGAGSARLLHRAHRCKAGQRRAVQTSVSSKEFLQAAAAAAAVG